MFGFSKRSWESFGCEVLDWGWIWYFMQGFHSFYHVLRVRSTGLGVDLVLRGQRANSWEEACRQHRTKKTPALAEGCAGAGVVWGYIWLPELSWSGRSGPSQVQISPNRSKSEQNRTNRTTEQDKQNRTNRTGHPNRPTGPELLQEVVEGLAERLFVGHAAVNEVAVADYVYCRY